VLCTIGPIKADGIIGGTTDTGIWIFSVHLVNTVLSSHLLFNVFLNASVVLIWEGRVALSDLT
jgi:hypothetical protein